MSNKVLVMGSFVADLAFRAARLPAWGETLMGDSFALGPGGKGSNQAVAAARAGAQVRFMSKLGDDAFGRIARDLWEADGIDASLVGTCPMPTGAAAILIDSVRGENAIIVVPGACFTLTPNDVDAEHEAIQATGVFLTQLELPLDTVQRGLEIARAAGVTTILNPAPAPTSPLPDALIARASLLRTAGGQSTLIPSFSAGPVVETTGAGHAFCGAFAAALAEGRGPEDAARFASACAGISVTRHGTAPSMPQRAEIEALLIA